MIVVICCLLFLQSVPGEDHLTQIDWKKKTNNIDFSRFWKTYTDYLLHILIMNCTFTKTMLYALQGIKVCSGIFCIKYFTLRHELITRNSSVSHGEIQFNNSRIEIKPTVSTEFFTPMSNGHIVGHYYVIFYPCKDLNLNITFIHISIIGIKSNVAVYKHLSKESQTSFKYSGIESTFSLYPPYHQLVFRIKTRTGARLPVVVTAMFSVISESILASSKPPTIKSLTITAIHEINVAKITVITYRIETERFKSIELDLHLKDRVIYALYIGPGYLSMRKELHRNERKFINTFQCILQVILPKLCGVGNISSHAIFRTQNLPSKQIYVASNIATSVKFPYTVCTKAMTCVLDIRNPAGYINITIMSFMFKGLPHPDCIYGGITWYESLILMSHCYKYSVNESLYIQNRNFFSQNSSILVVVYHYNEYSSLSVNFTLTSSKCKGIKLNICATYRTFRDIFGKKFIKMDFVRLYFKDKMKLYLSMERKSCFVLQFYILPYIQYNMFQYNCKVQIFMHREKPKQELWQFEISGYLRATIEKDTPNLFEKFDHNFTVSEKQINSRNHSHNHNKKESIFDLFDFLFKPDILISATYYIKTPTHFNSIRLFLSVYRWSLSWVNIVVNFTGQVNERMQIATPLANSYLDISHKIVKRREPVLVLQLFPNETIKAVITATSGRFSYYGWSEELIFTKYETENVVVVALQRSMNFVLISSNGSYPSLVEYQWIYPQFSKTPIRIKGRLCRENLDLRSSTRNFSVIKQVGSRLYHFNKTYQLPCTLLPNERFYVMVCAAEPLSWNQASQKCKDIGGSLPQFFSREEQEEIQYLLKMSDDLYAIEALYIGLVISNTSRYSQESKLFDQKIQMYCNFCF